MVLCLIAYVNILTFMSCKTELSIINHPFSLFIFSSHSKYTCENECSWASNKANIWELHNSTLYKFLIIINKLCKIMAMHEIRYLKGCISNSLLLFLQIYVPGAKCQKHFLWHLHHLHCLQKSSPWLHRETEPETQLMIEVLWRKFLSALGKDQNSCGACYMQKKPQNIRNIKTEIWGKSWIST